VLGLAADRSHAVRRNHKVRLAIGRIMAIDAVMLQQLARVRLSHALGIMRMQPPRGTNDQRNSNNADAERLGESH
jgi:hypothetical protein